SRNPNLELRVHWITKLAYGRDQEYVPYSNDGVDSTETVPYVYYYPGAMPAGSAAPLYYVPTGIKGKINIDGGTRNDWDFVANPHPYTLADTYNNAMRYYDEMNFWNERAAAGTETELTLRLLLDDLHLNPDKYRNALFVNLHGELVPIPPVRNYSDPAKNPTTHPYLRVVTHPEKVQFSPTVDFLYFRVHAFLSDPAYAGPEYPNSRAPLISVLIKGLPNTFGPGDVELTRIEGGVAPSAATYSSLNGPGIVGDANMWAEVLPGPEWGSILLKLHNTPVKAPKTADNRGLDTTKRLYDWEYTPCPTNGPNFTHGLDFVGVRGKNTARWVIKLPKTMMEIYPITIETRIGEDLTTGTLYPVRNQPANLSRTYTWVTTNAEVIPFTERYQFIGDPRHHPYGDARVSANDLAYNWFFTDAIAAADYSAHLNIWKGWDLSTAGSGTGNNNVEVDIPRFFQLVREGLMKSNALWTTITGYSYYYVGLGNEIGYDSANMFANSIPVDYRPWNSGATMDGTEQTILINEAGGTWGRGVKQIRGPGSWLARYWLGELVRDQEYATWSLQGNLPSQTYWRQNRDNAALPADIRFKAGRRTQAAGCGSFYNATSGGATNRFDHTSSAGNGTIAAALRNEMQTAFNYTLPATVPANRPFSFKNSTKGREWGQNPYLSGRNNGSLLVTLYNHPTAGLTSSGILQITKGPPNADVGAIFAANGISQTIETGSPFIARYCLVSLIYAFMRAGGDAVPNFSIPQLPRVRLTYPTDATELTDPVVIDITWDKAWLRWDGGAYSTFDAYTETAATPVFFVVMYSDDCGSTWKHIQDDSPATPGTRPTSDDYKIDGDTLTIPWDVLDFDEGSYYLRVECYRTNILPHYSYHQQKIYINR
ncbi:MAG: hypothetical protein RDV41_11135, partial [Planctomycetota bacterium]|nr:hypothetical protein [Planctomycetota bacterium]